MWGAEVEREIRVRVLGCWAKELRLYPTRSEGSLKGLKSGEMCPDMSSGKNILDAVGNRLGKVGGKEAK